MQPGLFVGEKITPITSAGLFVPSGKASYPSVAYQLGVPAIVARVPGHGPDRAAATGRIMVEVDPAVLVVCRKLGITKVFRVNGPAGVAALGFGTETLPEVRKIVGPGSPAVTCAQVEMQRHGVATMMLLGPTESVVIADDSADPTLLGGGSADRSRARHGFGSRADNAPRLRLAEDDRSANLEIQLADLPPLRATRPGPPRGQRRLCPGRARSSRRPR